MFNFVSDISIISLRGGALFRKDRKLKSSTYKEEKVLDELLFDCAFGEAFVGGLEDKDHARDENARDVLDVIFHAAADVAGRFVAVLHGQYGW